MLPLALLPHATVFALYLFTCASCGGTGIGSTMLPVWGSLMQPLLLLLLGA
jgi:hypothetical protein